MKANITNVYPQTTDYPGTVRIDFTVTNTGTQAYNFAVGVSIGSSSLGKWYDIGFFNDGQSGTPCIPGGETPEGYVCTGTLNPGASQNGYRTLQLPNDPDVKDVYVAVKRMDEFYTPPDYGVLDEELRTNVLNVGVGCDRWRILSYPTWEAPLQQYHYDTFNFIFHFNIEPNSDGTVDSGNVGGTQGAQTMIAEAHANNKLITVVIGGWGYGSRFQGACSNSNRARFVQEMVQIVALGYDGITFDWEEDVNNANLVQTIKDLRAELDKLTSRPLLLIDVCCDVTISSMVEVEPYVDSINTMVYTDNPIGYTNQIISAGVPPSKIINGMGFFSYVNSEARAREQAQMAIDMGLKGIEVWDSGEINGDGDVRTAVIRELLGTGPACV